MAESGLDQLVYREMNMDDYDEVYKFWQSTDGLRLRQADSRTAIERYLARNPGLSFVATQPLAQGGGRIIGSVMAGHDGKRGYLQHLAVAQIYRRKGIGAALIDRCLAALKAEGILKTHLFVLDDNEFAQAYWRNRGWKKRDDFSVYSFINSTEQDV